MSSELEHLDGGTAELIANADDREAEEAASRPDEPSLPPLEWLRANLFSSVLNTILTIVFGLAGVLAFQRLLNWAFSHEREWDAVRVNMRALFTFTYPSSQYGRIWITLGIALTLAGLSLGLSRMVGQGFSLKRISTWFMAWGGAVIAGILLVQPHAKRSANGEVLLDADFEPVRESFGTAMADRGWWWLIGVLLLVVGVTMWVGLGDLKRRTTFIGAIPFTLGVLAVLVSTLWWFHWGNYGEQGDIIEPGRTVKDSAKLPWTAMWVVLTAAYIVGRQIAVTDRAGSVRVLVNFSWLLTPFVTFWVILRDPAIDYAHVWSTDLPMAVAFIIGGGAVLFLLTKPGLGEVGRIISIGLFGVAIINWVAAFFGIYPMLQKARISFLLLALIALAAHNFAGERKQRLRFVLAWAGVMAILHNLVTMINAPSTVDAPDEFVGGFLVTVYIAAFTMIFSFPLGILLALGRTSTLPIFRVLSTIYIETVRGVPFITILFFFSTFLNIFLPDGMEIEQLAAAGLGFALFSAAYLAENIRGGLQAVRRGQYEASDALGLTTVQRTGFIVLPQALRVSIPPLVGATISTFKETSLLAIIGIIDFLRVANSVVPGQTVFLGVRMEGLLFVCMIYWVGAYSMSKFSQRLERHLGVGEH
ncbi:MAG: amino acid ABC transporter permease [Acidimicrobiales bacterium]|nr:amino acid ABC transporter permease [Acidimicrobiales bacterium]